MGSCQCSRHLSPDDQLRTLPTLADLARELPSCPSCLIAAALSVAPETRDQWPGQPSPPLLKQGLPVTLGAPGCTDPSPKLSQITSS